MMVITTSAGLAIIIIRDSHRLHVHLHLHAHFNIYIHSWRACLYVFLDYFNYDGNLYIFINVFIIINNILII